MCVHACMCCVCVCVLDWCACVYVLCVCVCVWCMHVRVSGDGGIKLRTEVSITVRCNFCVHLNHLNITLSYCAVLKLGLAISKLNEAPLRWWIESKVAIKIHR